MDELDFGFFLEDFEVIEAFDFGLFGLFFDLSEELELDFFLPDSGVFGSSDRSLLEFFGDFAFRSPGGRFSRLAFGLFFLVPGDFFGGTGTPAPVIPSDVALRSGGGRGMDVNPSDTAFRNGGGGVTDLAWLPEAACRNWGGPGIG